MRTSSSPLIPLSTHVDEEELTFVLPKCSPIGDVFDVLDNIPEDIESGFIAEHDDFINSIS